MILGKKDIRIILAQLEEQSPCIRRRIGAFLISKEGKIVKAYNGNLEKPCNKNFCLREKMKVKSGVVHSLCFGIHAEIRLILHCLENGTDLKDSVVYCTFSPCIDCATVLATYEIKAFYFLFKYPDDRYISVFDNAGIKYGLI